MVNRSARNRPLCLVILGWNAHRKGVLVIDRAGATEISRGNADSPQKLHNARERRQNFLRLVHRFWRRPSNHHPWSVLLPHTLLSGHTATALRKSKVQPESRRLNCQGPVCQLPTDARQLPIDAYIFLLSFLSLEKETCLPCWKTRPRPPSSDGQASSRTRSWALRCLQTSSRAPWCCGTAPPRRR